MSTDIIFFLAPFPTGQGMDANTYGQQLVANLSAQFTRSILTGQTLGVQPATNIGPWFDGTTWWFWDSSSNQYLPQPSGPNPFFNAILNPAMQVNQRVGPYVNPVAGTYMLDRYRYRTSLVTGNITVSQSTLGLAGNQWHPRTRYGMQISCSTQQPSLGPTEYSAITQMVIRNRARMIIDSLSSFSLSTVSNILGTFYVCIRNADQSWTYLLPCRITVAGIEQRFAFPNISVMPSTSGNWGSIDTDYSYEVMFVLAAGANLNKGVAGIWQNTNTICGADQANFFNSINNTISLTLWQHQAGATPTPILFQDLNADLLTCQPYFCKSYDYAQASGVPAIGSGLIRAPCFNTTNAQALTRFPVRMIANPSTVNIYSFNNGTLNAVSDMAAGVDRTVASIAAIGEGGFTGINITGSTFSPASAGFTNFAQFHYTADAELHQ